MPREKQDAVNLIARLPPEVHAALKADAAKNERSLNAQLVVILRAALLSKRRRS
jgi:hypothetical protein